MPVSQQNLVFNIIDLQCYKENRNNRKILAKNFHKLCIVLWISLSLWKQFHDLVASIVKDGMEQLEMPFSLHLHVPAICKTHELYFHKVKESNQANEYYCCECRLILFCKQILIPNCFLKLGTFWWKKTERAGIKIVNSTSQSDFFTGFCFPCQKWNWFFILMY